MTRKHDLAVNKKGIYSRKDITAKQKLAIYNETKAYFIVRDAMEVHRAANSPMAYKPGTSQSVKDAKIKKASKQFDIALDKMKVAQAACAKAGLIKNRTSGWGEYVPMDSDVGKASILMSVKGSKKKRTKRK